MPEPEDSEPFFPNLFLPDKITLEMWDDDISSTYKMDFISVLTSTLDDASFFTNMNNSATDIEEPKFNPTIPHKYEVPSPSETTDSCESTPKNWEETPIKQWTCIDVIQWLKHNIYNTFNINITNDRIIECFQNVDGLALSSMTLSDFLTVTSMYGNFLYEKLQSHLRSENSVCELHQLLPIDTSYKDIPSDVVSLMLSESQLNFSQGLRDKLNKELQSSTHYLPTCLAEDFLVDQKQCENIQIKKRPGRPRGMKRRKQSEHRLGRLWEFIRDLLLSEKYCPKYICWDNYEEGKFRFVESDKVAKLWGSIKGNANMNYEKFSRAMRYYYKSEVLLPVEGRRLVYKFGPKATGWRTNNPNFQL